MLAKKSKYARQPLESKIQHAENTIARLSAKRPSKIEWCERKRLAKIKHLAAHLKHYYYHREMSNMYAELFADNK